MNNGLSKNGRTIMLVDDDRVDAMTVQRAFKELQVSNPLVVLGNGEEALEYLRDPVNPRPAIILLDLNMPRMNGLEFLKIVKADPELRRIPVIVLTTSSEEQDRMSSFYYCAAGYIVKPVEYREFIEAMRKVSVYWTLSELPPA